MQSHYEYQSVASDSVGKNHLQQKNDSWKPFLRQLMIAISYWILYFNCGLCLGAPTVLIPQLRRQANSTDFVSTEMAIWLSSVLGYAAIPWIFILPILMSYFGRKIVFIFVSMWMIGVFICYIISTTPTHILITEVFQGMPHAASLTIALAIATEYISPKYRGVFLTFKAATFNWGIWVSNAIGVYFNWKYISLLGLLCSLCTLNVFFWPRSPFWLATKGRFEECRQAYRWLAGESESTEKDLENLIASQIKYCKDRNKSCNSKSFKRISSFLLLKEFYKPVLLCSLLMVMYLLSGKLVCTMYAIDIIKDLTDSESAAYTGMLILDGVSVLCMYVGCVIARFTKRRTLLMVFGTISGLFLLALSLYCYLTKLSILSVNKYVAISLLVGFSVATALGPFIIIMCMFAEMLPINYKSEAVTLISFIFVITQSSMFKFSPYIFRYWGSHSAFLFYGITVLICAGILYKYLPETKDKTLQEIEEYFKHS